MVVLEPGIYFGHIDMTGYDGKVEVTGEIMGYDFIATKGDMLIALAHKSTKEKPDIRVRNILHWTDSVIIFEKFKL